MNNNGQKIIKVSDNIRLGLIYPYFKAGHDEFYLKFDTVLKIELRSRFRKNFCVVVSLFGFGIGAFSDIKEFNPANEDVKDSGIEPNC